MAENIEKIVSYDLSSILMPAGNPEITATGLTESEKSNAVTYSSEYLNFVLLSDNTYKVAGLKENYEGIANVKIPSKYGGIDVKSIGSSAFKGNQNIEAVTIPASITQIGSSAFEDCTNLSSVEFEPDSYYTLFFRNIRGWTNVCCAERHNYSWKYGEPGLEMTFSHDEGNGYAIFKIRVLKSTLNSIKFSGINQDGVREYTTEISKSNCSDYYCWESSGAGVVSRYEDFIPAGLTISTKAFKNSRIEEIIIPNSVGAITASVFEDCSRLSRVTLPQTFKIIGNSAFAGCGWLNYITIPAGVHTIGKYAFKNSALLTAYIPYTILSIGEGAYANCDLLEEATILCSADISDYAFNGCTSLSRVNFNEKLENRPIIESHTKSIGRYAFEGTALTSVVIPASVTWIGYKAFWNVKTLKHATFENIYGWFVTLADGKYDGHALNIANNGNEPEVVSEQLAAGFIGKLGFEEARWYRLEQMIAPVISLAETILTITDSTGIAESFKIYINDDEECIAHIDINGNLITA